MTWARRLSGRYFRAAGPRARWFVVLMHRASGYIGETSTADWNIEEQLTQVRTRAGTGGRQVLGWIQTPAYDAVYHHLVWAVATRMPGQTGATVNYNTFALGRRGYIGLDLVTDGAGIRTHARIARDLLGAVRFKPDHRYEDFDPKTDARAPYTIETLVTGVTPPRPAVARSAFVPVLLVLAAPALALTALLARGRGRRVLSGRADSADRPDRLPP